MKALIEPVSKLHEIREIENKKFPLLIRGLVDVERCNIIEVLTQKLKKRHRLIITYDEIRGRQLYEDLRLYDSTTMFYQAKDFMFFSADIHGSAIVASRLEVIKRLIDASPTTIVLSVEALLDKVLPINYLKKNTLKIVRGKSYDLHKLSKELVKLGYEKKGQVTGKGEFAVRGAVFDVFSLTEELPTRVEFFGDEVDSLRNFDIESQRSIENIEEVVIYPATEIVMDDEVKEAGILRLIREKDELVKKLRKEFKTEEAARLNGVVDGFREKLELYGGAFGTEAYIDYFFEETVSFLDYFGEEDLFFVDEPLRVEERCKSISFEWRESMLNRLEKGYILPKQATSIWNYRTIFSKLENRNTILLSLLETRTGEIEVSEQIEIVTRNISPYNNSFESLIKDLERYKRERYKIVLLSASKHRAMRLEKELLERELMANFTEDINRIPVEGEVLVAKGNLRKGFEYPQIKFAVISESDIFGAEKIRKSKKKRRTSEDLITNFSELKTGDYVIHEGYGIGIYRGIEKITVEDVTKDYLKIEYGGGGSVFVPTTAMDVLQKYSSSKGSKPKIDKIGGGSWKKTKDRVRASVREVAKDLVELYAKRQLETGFSYGEDTVWQKEFEELFPYEETEDQINAISDVKKDMESPRIMDRLICGDVGFGKTEVAIRGAFKAISYGKQVAMLVPTTILAGQHYKTFVDRLRDFPINIEFVSRFKTSKEVAEIKKKLKAGIIDIVIGTHKLLSKDFSFKDLGLLIVDEEQRFGVSHKEKIKKLKENVDVLTLSATPIPRTLHMSLVGIRDMSVLEEPPIDRIPIQTYVMERDDEIIREAITREVSRAGQVYYVYNRVNGIDEVAIKLREMLPNIRVSFAHGQMNERELENIMQVFISREIDVLVSTTIIETGIDIANVNTIIIEDADKMGLSQLYQLRGRVGRSTRTSFAFLMYRRDMALREVAEKRLAAIKEFTDLGSGFKIAMRDLEIRGAGNLLGKSQSGHIDAVGYDLYCKMLNEEVKRLKGEKINEDEFETVIDMDVSAYIPSEYIKNEVLRLEMYKKIASLSTEEDLLDLKDELIDRYGEIKKEVDNLVNISYIREIAHKFFASRVSCKDGIVKIQIYKEAKFDVDKIGNLISQYEGGLKLRLGKEDYFEYTLKPKLKEEERIVSVMKLVEGILSCQIKED